VAGVGGRWLSREAGDVAAPHAPRGPDDPRAWARPL